jgi:hypothetical protein
VPEVVSLFGHLRGKLLVERSRDPDCDAARALLANGITGELTLLDGKTGRPRIIINIEKAAKLRVEEGPNGPRFVKWRGTVVDGPYTLKRRSLGREIPKGLRERSYYTPDLKF